MLQFSKLVVLFVTMKTSELPSVVNIVSVFIFIYWNVSLPLSYSFLLSEVPSNGKIVR